MNWLTQLRTKLGYDEVSRITIDEQRDNGDGAEYALETARAALNHAKERREEVQEISSTLSEIRKHNHLGESIEIAFQRRRKSA